MSDPIENQIKEIIAEFRRYSLKLFNNDSEKRTFDSGNIAKDSADFVSAVFWNLYKMAAPKLINKNDDHAAGTMCDYIRIAHSMAMDDIKHIVGTVLPSKRGDYSALVDVFAVDLIGIRIAAKGLYAFSYDIREGREGGL